MTAGPVALVEGAEMNHGTISTVTCECRSRSTHPAAFGCRPVRTRIVEAAVVFSLTMVVNRAKVLQQCIMGGIGVRIWNDLLTPQRQSACQKLKLATCAQPHAALFRSINQRDE